MLSSIQCGLRAGNNVRAILTGLRDLAKPSPTAPRHSVTPPQRAPRISRSASQGPPPARGRSARQPAGSARTPRRASAPRRQHASRARSTGAGKLNRPPGARFHRTARTPPGRRVLLLLRGGDPHDRFVRIADVHGQLGRRCYERCGPWPRVRRQPICPLCDATCRSAVTASSPRR